jgi:hypothetical protein
MIAHQNQSAPFEGDVADREKADMRTGAEILRVALEYDELFRRLGSRTEALHRLARQKSLDPRILQALLEAETSEDEHRRSCAIRDLATGMLLADDIRTSGGLLVAEKGHEVTKALILKLKNLELAGTITRRHNRDRT